MTRAAEEYRVEEFRLPTATYLVSAALSVLVATATLGGGATPIVRSGYRIRRVADHSVVAEVADSISTGAGTRELLRSDLLTMTVDEFDRRWL